MKNDEEFRVELVPPRLIKRMPGPMIGASPKGVDKARGFTRERGHCLPVVLSESDGCMTLLSNSAAFEACLEEKGAKIPAVIVRTGGGADNLIFALQTAALNESPDAIAVSAAIVQLLDVHGLTRKHITESLGKSRAWVSRMENLSRKLNKTVQLLVSQGHMPARSAQDIARLPDDVQAAFAISAGNEFLSKEDVAYLVNRYLDAGTGEEERSRIINSPRLALPGEAKSRRRQGGDISDSARLSRAMARCMDCAAFLSRLLERIDLGVTTVHPGDASALADALSDLNRRIRALFAPDKNKGERIDVID